MREGPRPIDDEKLLERVPNVKEIWAKIKKVVGANVKGRAYDDKGQFYPDPTPIAPPIGYVEEPSMFDRVRQMIRQDASIRAQAEGFESFEEADDFDIEDDIEPFSPYELITEQRVPDGPAVNGEQNNSSADPLGAQTAEPSGKSAAGQDQSPPAAPAASPAQK